MGLKSPVKTIYLRPFERDYNILWVFPKIGVPQNRWFIMETLLKWMIWGENPLFSETPL